MLCDAARRSFANDTFGVVSGSLLRIVLSRAEITRWRRSLRSITSKSSPAINGSRYRAVILCRRDTNGFEQLPFQTVSSGTSRNIWSQSAGFEMPVDEIAAVVLGILEGKDIPRADNIPFHAADLTDALDPANAIPHPFDLHDQIDRTGDLRP